jgi:hypothetical protein
MRRYLCRCGQLHQPLSNAQGLRLQETAEMGDATVRYANVNGLKMYYEVHGSGRPLVLLHGAFGTAEGWAPLLPALSNHAQVIILEQQGHGHTVDRNGPLTYEQMAEDMRHCSSS